MASSTSKLAELPKKAKESTHEPLSDDSLKVLFAVERSSAPALVDSFTGLLRHDCTITYATEVASVGMEVLRDTHDIFVIDGRTDLSGFASLFNERGTNLVRRVVFVAVDASAPAWSLPHGAVRIPVDGITVETLESILELALERTAFARQLSRSQARYVHTALSSSDGLWFWDVRRDQCDFSDRWHKLLGLPTASGSSSINEWLDRVHPDDIDGLRANLDAHLEGLSPGHVFEHRVRHRNGRWRWVMTRAVAERNDLGQVTEVAGSLTDITRRKSSESMLQTDATTGLASRMWLMESLGEAIEALRQVPHPGFVLLFLNVDGFKVVNESIGLDSGDRILSQLGERLLGNVASNHLVCRYGGDEFAILMRGDATVQDAEQLSAIIQDGLNRPFIIDGQEVFTSVSAGVTSSDIGYERPSEVLRDVGIALTEAKRNRRGGCVVFQPDMRKQAMTALRLQTELRQAVDRDELEVYYQPIVNLSTSVMSGFEALVRWRHPVRGMVMPDEFVTVAEETGLIIPIGKMVLECACNQLAMWLGRYPSPDPLSVSVNLSTAQVVSSTIVEDVRSAIERSKIPPHCLKLEITESMLIEDTEDAKKVFGQLRSLGVRLLIDDFGTGYSSLTYLHEFPASGLKIDKSFVDMLGKTESPAAIVPTIISLAHSLSLDVVAEGVETQEQRDLLRSLACNEAQGFLFSPPLEHHEATLAVANRHDQYSATMPHAAAPSDGTIRRYRR